ncbi:hypothetical protein A3N37_00160 [Enterobacter ludwigii]|uniref:hypothetical protein n=1 Tax=Enterobacter ludwigii TaxID=299767 RepID=UPI0007B35879|nr:hypothetical protein [Enterobacter ludwigii]KZP51275.1 hypothetical protein A3N37_00160 [Enterobacter ludwigii]
MSNVTLPTLDATKLYENAVLSIQLGIEDFQLSQKDLDAGGNPARALSSVRNLFAGVMLLFKYKLATSVNDPADAYRLIHIPPKDILPNPDGMGGMIWEPEGQFTKNKTIDVHHIKGRFKTFNIDVDWAAVDNLHNCRNHLEHLHPKNTLGELSDFVAHLFPVLTDFITKELEESPQDFLGSAWDIMLKHQTFYLKKQQECAETWLEAGVPHGMEEFIHNSSCEHCGSKLLSASTESLEQGYTVEYDENDFEYQCVGWGCLGIFAPRLIDSFEHAFFYWPPDGDEPTYEHCYSCDHDTFVISEQTCRWCDNELDYTQCKICEAPLNQDDQINDGLCGYCVYKISKDD